MATYRHIHTTFWQDDFVLNLESEEKYFYLYLMTNSKTNQLGCYQLPKKVIMFETGHSMDTVEKLIEKFIEYKKIKYDYITNEILIINWCRYNWSKSPKVVSCIKKEFENVKNIEFRKNIESLFIQYGYNINTGIQDEIKGMDTGAQNEIYSMHTETQKKEKEKEKQKEKQKEKKEEKENSDTVILELENDKKNHETQNIYFTSKSLNDIFLEFIKMRKDINCPMDKKAIEFAIKKINNLANNDNDKINIIKRSIKNKWKSFFELKENTKKNVNHESGEEEPTDYENTLGIFGGDYSNEEVVDYENTLGIFGATYDPEEFGGKRHEKNGRT